MEARQFFAYLINDEKRDFNKHGALRKKCPCSELFCSEWRKITTRITANTATFHATKRAEWAKLSITNVSNRAILANLWKVYDEAFLLNVDLLRWRDGLAGANKHSPYKLLSMFHYGDFYYQNWQNKNL